MSGLTLIEGHARFIEPSAMDVSGETLKSNRIFINVGGRAAVPDLPGIRDVPYLTNSSILQLDRIPRHLVVMGGSYIGLEFAQIYSSRSVGLRSKATMRAPGEIEPGAWLLEIGLKQEMTRLRERLACDRIWLSSPGRLWAWGFILGPSQLHLVSA